jgi:hypothetical protein
MEYTTSAFYEGEAAKSFHKWKASVSKVSGYHVYRADGHTEPGLLAATDADTTQLC